MLGAQADEALLRESFGACTWACCVLSADAARFETIANEAKVKQSWLRVMSRLAVS